MIDLSNSVAGISKTDVSHLVMWKFVGKETSDSNILEVNPLLNLKCKDQAKFFEMETMSTHKTNRVDLCKIMFCFLKR